MMARTLSPIARRELLLTTVVAALLAAEYSSGEQAEHAAPPTSIKNPFSAGALSPALGPQVPQRPRRNSGIYHNPFAAFDTAPPIETPPLPGPVSRWRRSSARVDEHSPVRTAILSTDLVDPAHIPWELLPAAENMRARGVARAAGTDAPAGKYFASPPDPLDFASDSLTQPVWLTVEPPSARPSRNDGVRMTTYEASHRGDSFDARRARNTQSNTQVSPEIISGIVDSPEGWLAQAQELARNAHSEDDLSTVADLCQRGMGGRPSAELASSLRRLGAWAHNRRGELMADDGREEEAIIDFQSAISLDPNCSLAIHNRAVTLAQQNQLAAALRDFNRVIDLNPGLAVAYRNRAELLAALGRMNEAVADYNRAMDSMPGDAELYAARSYAWQRAGDYARARSDLDRAIEIAPEFPNAFTQRGNLAAEQGDFEQALADFQRALEIDANGAEAHRCLAWLYATCSDERFRDPERALAEAQQAAEHSSSSDYHLIETLAAAYAATGQFDEAAELQQQAISAAPIRFAAVLKQRLSLFQEGKAIVCNPAGSTVRAAAYESLSDHPSADVRTK